MALVAVSGGELPVGAQQTAQYFYDLRGRLILFIAPDGTSTSYEYDPTGNLLSIKNVPQGQLVRISAITPTTGLVSGSQVTITGENFSTNPSTLAVFFPAAGGGQVQATLISSSATQLVVRVPAGAASGPVRVSSNGQNVSGPAVTIQAPGISAVSPAGPLVSGTLLTITGQGFSLLSGGNVVKFTGASGAEIPVTVTADSQTQLRVTVPAGTVSGALAVQVDAQTVNGPSLQVQPPGITSLSPVGPYQFGATLTISGQGFSLLPGGNTVNFTAAGGATIPVVVSTTTASRLIVQIPQGTASGPLSVSVAPLSAPGPSIQIQNLQISAVSPLSPVVSGQSITITGQGFDANVGGNAVRFTGEGGALISVTPTTASATQLTVQVPLGAVSGPVRVDVPPQSAVGPAITVQPLTITNFSDIDALGPLVTGTSFALLGQGFSLIAGGNAVTFSGRDGTTASQSYSTTDSTRLLVQIPAGAVTGPVTVSVAPVQVQGSVQIRTLVIDSVSPNPVVIGDALTISGLGFNSNPSAANTSVQFASVNGQWVSGEILSGSATQLQVKVPSNAATGAIRVTSDSYVFLEPPTVQILYRPLATAISPTSVSPGQSLFIDGFYFSPTAGDNTVVFAGPNGTTAQAAVLASNFIGGSSFRLQVQVPANAVTGTVTITVDGQSAQTPPVQITPLQIASVGIFSGANPNIAPGSLLVINGQGFSLFPGGNIVSFSGVGGTPIQVTALPGDSYSTFLTATVPPGAVSGPISISTATQTATWSQSLIIRNTQVTSITPDGAVVPGQVITLNGQDFDATSPTSTAVYFQLANNQQVQARVQSLTPTQIAVIVPAGVVSGPVRVDTYGRQIAGPVVPIQALSIASYEPSGTLAPGQTLTINGQGFPTAVQDPNNLAYLTVAFSGPAGQPAFAFVLASSPTQLQVQVPNTAVAGPITVNVPPQTAVGPAISLQALQVSAVTPSTNLVPGQSVVLTGQGFNSAPNENLVTFAYAGSDPYFGINGRYVAQVIEASATQLTVVVPLDFQAGPIAVSVNGVEALSPSVSPVSLQINSVSPASGLQPNATLTISGTGFNPNLSAPAGSGATPPPTNRVLFTNCAGGLSEGVILSASASQLVVQLPADFCPGPFSVQSLGQTAIGPALSSHLDRKPKLHFATRIEIASGQTLATLQVPFPRFVRRVRFTDSAGIPIKHLQLLRRDRQFNGSMRLSLAIGDHALPATALIAMDTFFGTFHGLMQIERTAQ